MLATCQFLLLAAFYNAVAADQIQLNGTSLCLDHGGQGQESFPSMDTCNGGDNQKWDILLIQDPARFHILPSNNESLCLEDYKYDATPGARVDLWLCHNYQNQMWYTKDRNNNTALWIFRDGVLDLCLDFTNNNVTLQNCTGGASQQFMTSQWQPPTTTSNSSKIVIGVVVAIGVAAAILAAFFVAKKRQKVRVIQEKSGENETTPETENDSFEKIIVLDEQKPVNLFVVMENLAESGSPSNEKATFQSPNEQSSVNQASGSISHPTSDIRNLFLTDISLIDSSIQNLSLPLNPADWSVEQTAAWVASNTRNAGLAGFCIEHNVDGRRLANFDESQIVEFIKNCNFEEEDTELVEGIRRLKFLVNMNNAPAQELDSPPDYQ